MAIGHDRGREGERRAAAYLEGQGWEVLARNWRDGPRELDLVVARGGVLAFVEVKTRGGRQCGVPAEAVTWRKRREIERAAAAWLRGSDPPISAWEVVRFDVLSVLLGPGPAGGEDQIEHLEDAWWRGE
jgi:putative endonuclease